MDIEHSGHDADERAMEGPAAPFVIARHDLARGRPDRALAALSKVSGAELDTFEFWSLRARALYGVRQWKDAIAASRTGLELEPDDLQLLDVLALAQLESGERKQARATIDHAITLYPEMAILRAHRALIMLRSARRGMRFLSIKRIRATADEALQLDPDCEAALRVRAQVATLSHERDAQEYVSELLSLDPEDEQAHVLAGLARARRGDLSGGLEHYVEAARLDPADARIAWLGRRSRILQGRLAAPMIAAYRLTRGHFRLVWFFVVIASIAAHQPLLTAAVFAFWIYMWAMRFYVRWRAGKAPK